RPFFAGGVHNGDFTSIGGGHFAIIVGEECVAGSASSETFDTRTHKRGMRLNERNGLALHVRSHGGAGVVVVLQERNKRGGNREDLARRHVDVRDIAHVSEERFTGAAGGNASREEFAILREANLGLSNGEMTLLF